MLLGEEGTRLAGAPRLMVGKVVAGNVVIAFNTLW